MSLHMKNDYWVGFHRRFLCLQKQKHSLSPCTTLTAFSVCERHNARYFFWYNFKAKLNEIMWTICYTFLCSKCPLRLKHYVLLQLLCDYFSKWNCAKYLFPSHHGSLDPTRFPHILLVQWQQMVPAVSALHPNLWWGHHQGTIEELHATVPQQWGAACSSIITN